MLLAEIHGKRVEEAQNSEDYLTSTVFGHLRYLPPEIFWESLLRYARDTTAQETALTEVVCSGGLTISSYTELSIRFWPHFPGIGEPDLVLDFSAPDTPGLTIVVEAKLFAGKSGTGEDDQLARYLTMRPRAPNGVALLVYLTPRDSLAEINESLASRPDLEQHRWRMFRLQWQHILLAADQGARGEHGLHAVILSDVAAFLRRRGLMFFDGFRYYESLGELAPGDGAFYRSENAVSDSFSGMTMLAPLEDFPIERGGWTQ